MRGKESEKPTTHIQPETSMEGLHDYFLGKLPPGLSREVFENLSCIGYARLIVEELGGEDRARIYFVLEDDNIGDNGEGDLISHAFVVPTDALPTDLAYNNWLGPRLTVERVRTLGEDITFNILHRGWEGL